MTFGRFQMLICILKSVVIDLKMKKNISGAPIVMRNRGRKTDSIVLDIVKEKSGITVQEIANNLGWTNGRVDGSINRLAKKGKIRIQYFMRKKSFIKKLYPIREKQRPFNVIEIPKEDIERSLWGDEVLVYSLSRGSIGISPTKIDEWGKKAFWKEKVTIEEEDEKLKVKLPDKLSDFYRLENSEVSLATDEDFALITVEEAIVPVRIQPAQIEIPQSRKLTQYFMIFGKVERDVLSSGYASLESFYVASIGKEETIPNVNLSETDIDMVTIPIVERKFGVTEQELEVSPEAIVT